MAAAVGLGAEAHAGPLAADVEGADPLGAVELVPRHGEEIDLHGVDVDGHLARALGGVHVQQHALGAGDFADGREVLDRADLVVGVQDAHEDGVGADGRLEGREVDQAEAIDVQVGDLVAQALQVGAGVEGRLVLDLGGDEVLALLGVHLGDALEGEVDRLGGPGGQDDLLAAGVAPVVQRADQQGDLLAGLLDALLGGPPVGVVAARGVAEVLGEVGQHGLEDPGVHRGGGVVVQVDHARGFLMGARPGRTRPRRAGPRPGARVPRGCRPRAPP
ncbi:hypothetical protein D3C86_1297620 [compost metagenome]